MKKAAISLVILLFTSIFSMLNAQDIERSKKEVQEILCNNVWMQDYVIIDGAETKSYLDADLQFNSDGKYVSTINGVETYGTWKYDENDKCVELVNQGNVSRIIHLNNDRFTMILVNPELPEDLRLLKYHFKTKS